MKINNTITFIIISTIFSYMYGIDYQFARLNLQDPSLNQVEAYNPRYVDKSLIVTDDLADDFHDCIWYIKVPAQGFIYWINLPILRLAELYEYPGYQTFSRFITNPSIIGISLLAGTYLYKAFNHKEKDQDLDNKHEVENHNNITENEIAKN